MWWTNQVKSATETSIKVSKMEKVDYYLSVNFFFARGKQWGP